MPRYYHGIRLVAHLDVNHKYHGGKLGKGRIESFQSGVSWTIPYLERDDRTERGGSSRREKEAKLREKYALESVLSQVRCCFEIEGFAGREVVE